MTKKTILIKFLTIGLAITLLPACIAKQTLAEEILATQDMVTVQAESAQVDANQEAELEALSAQFETDDQRADELYRQALAQSNQRAIEVEVDVEVDSKDVVETVSEVVAEEVVESEDTTEIVTEQETEDLTEQFFIIVPVNDAMDDTLSSNHKTFQKPRKPMQSSVLTHGEH